VESIQAASLREAVDILAALRLNIAEELGKQMLGLLRLPALRKWTCLTLRIADFDQPVTDCVGDLAMAIDPSAHCVDANAQPARQLVLRPADRRQHGAQFVLGHQFSVYIVCD
jgi:hypothetical protein